MYGRIWRLGLCLLGFLSPAVVRAQLRGVVRDGPTRAPLSGAVVTVLDRAGATTARTITDVEGRFTVGIAPAAASLRVVRIGFRPRDVPVPSTTSAALEIVMERIPPMLNAVHVTDNELCPGSTDRGAAFQVWEQARAGLLATVVARELKPANARTLAYESRLAPNDERVRKQTTRIGSGRTTRPFVSSQTPVYFARHGYILEDGSTRIYNAPDADVLLDESFATTHCFRVQAADADHRGQIGLAFTPAPGRDTLPDVTGVIWIDGTVPQLRSLDFLYTALERAAMSMKTGGHIEFRTMPNGVAFIERWHLRLPALELLSSPRKTGNPSQDLMPSTMRQDRTDFRVYEIIEAGGVVLSATWDDGAEYRDTAAVIRGTVTQRKTNAPVAHAIVTLVGTADTALTDAAGQFVLEVIPGKYGLSVADTALHAFVQSRMVSQTVSVGRAQTTSTHLELAPIGEVVEQLCRGIQVFDREVILIGHVFAADRPRIPNAVVTTTWESASMVGGQIAERKVRRDSDVDDEGRFVVCGVQLERPVRLRLNVGNDVFADTTIRLDKPDLTQPIEWRIVPPARKP